MYKEYMEKLLLAFKELKVYRGNIRMADYEEAMTELIASIRLVKTSGRTLFFVGNGGSAGIASHMTVDFMKNGGMKTYNFYDASVLTCMGNDYGYEFIFSKPLQIYGESGDLLIAISSSGNSKSIMNAIESARKKGMRVITFSGFQEDNIIKSLGDYNVYVPLSHYGIVESIHNMILQQIVDEILSRDGNQFG